MFFGSKLKIDRAHKHIRDFEDSVDAYIKSDFYEFVAGPNTAGGPDISVFRIQFNKQPPADLALILGDAVHCLRAALDLAFVELVTRAGRQPTKWTTFRVWDDREKLIATLGKGILQGAPDLISMLSDAVKAYVGGNPLLTALDALDIDDKHRLLIPVLSITSISGINAELQIGGGNIVYQDCSFTVDSTGCLNLLGAPGPVTKLNVQKGIPHVSALFGGGTGLEGQPIIPTLHQFSLLVSGILVAFEDVIAARAT